MWQKYELLRVVTVRAERRYRCRSRRCVQVVQVRPRKLSRHSQAHSGSVSSAVGLASTLGMIRVMGWWWGNNLVSLYFWRKTNWGLLSWILIPHFFFNRTLGYALFIGPLRHLHWWQQNIIQNCCVWWIHGNTKQIWWTVNTFVVDSYIMSLNCSDVDLCDHQVKLFYPWFSGRSQSVWAERARLWTSSCPGARGSPGDSDSTAGRTLGRLSSFRRWVSGPSFVF